MLQSITTQSLTGESQKPYHFLAGSGKATKKKKKAALWLYHYVNV